MMKVTSFVKLSDHRYRYPEKAWNTPQKYYEEGKCQMRIKFDKKQSELTLVNYFLDIITGYLLSVTHASVEIPMSLGKGKS